MDTQDKAITPVGQSLFTQLASCLEFVEVEVRR